MRFSYIACFLWVSDTEQLDVGGVRIDMVFITRQTIGEGAGSPLPPDQLTGFLTYLFLWLHVWVCVCVCVGGRAKVKPLHLNKVALFFSSLPSKWRDLYCSGQIQEVLNPAVNEYQKTIQTSVSFGLMHQCGNTGVEIFQLWSGSSMLRCKAKKN